MAWLQRVAGDAEIVLSVCNGALVDASLHVVQRLRGAGAEAKTSDRLAGKPGAR